MYILAYVYGDDYCNIPILLCAGESGYSSERELLLYYCSKARESNTNCLNNQLYIYIYIYITFPTIVLCFTYKRPDKITGISGRWVGGGGGGAGKGIV